MRAQGVTADSLFLTKNVVAIGWLQMGDLSNLISREQIKDKYCEEHPEKILECSDWMGIGIRPYKITLDRFKNLLLDCVI